MLKICLALVLSATSFAAYEKASAKPTQWNSTKPSLPIVETYDKKPKSVPTQVFDEKGTLTPTQLKMLLQNAGFRGQNLETAWAIVMRESGGRPKAHNLNPNTGDNSYGLFQINMHGSLADSRREKFDLRRNDDLFNPLTNARVAYHMSRRGTDFGAWAIGRNSYREDRSADLMRFRVQYPR